MSTFVSHLSSSLSLRILSSSRPKVSTPECVSPQSRKSLHDVEILRDYFLRLQPPATLQAARECLTTLQTLGQDLNTAVSNQADAEDDVVDEQATLCRAILGKLVIGLYVQSLNTFLEEASVAETELEWWDDVARSRWRVSLFLLQTFPARLFNTLKTILHTVESRGIPLRLSVLSPSSLRLLFPSRGLSRPNALAVSLFPYLRHQPYAITLSGAPLPPAQLQAHPRARAPFWLTSSLCCSLRALWTCLFFPFSLARGECEYKRKELEKVRDERAEVLGALSNMKQQLLRALVHDSNEKSITELSLFASQLQFTIRGNSPLDDPITDQQGVLGPLHYFAYTTLPAHISSHSAHLSAYGLLRPSRLTLLWPKLVFLPPMVLFLIRAAYNSRASLMQVAEETLNTVKDFWEGWLMGPLKDVVKTIRAEGDSGVIVSQESVKADLESLERMTLALAQDKLGYGPEQMAALSAQVRLGDLTAVMQLYEDDIKSPLRSAVGGTLLRTLFVQVQKAKVDIDKALSGIDKLLKSQELTFAFVGVAPALAVIYGIKGALSGIWTGSVGQGRYGGKRRRVRVWLVLRRIERLLIAQPSGDLNPPSESGNDAISPLTSGLLLLSVTHLRKYAETHLPANSRLREGFLEDIVDLESPVLGRGEKLRVVDRMWKSWGVILGWEDAAIQ